LLLYFAFVYAVLSSLPHSKVVRFVENLEMVLVLFAVFALKRSRRAGNGKGRNWLVYCVTGIFIYNWEKFLSAFLRAGIADPIQLLFIDEPAFFFPVKKAVRWCR